MEGDIDLNERNETHIQVGEVIASLSAESSRTTFVSPSLFDPEGKLLVEFYEGIDLQASQITSDKLIEKGYEEKCKGNLEEYYYGSSVECEKEEDKKKIYFIFDKGVLDNFEIIKINFEKIKNLEGLELNAAPIIKEAVVYPKLKILKSIPQNNAQNVSLTEFIICSNTPLIPPAKEDIDSYLKISAAYEYKDWQQSVLVPDNPGDYYKCLPGQFESRINYGMMPETDYFMELKLVDSFGQELSSFFNFRTDKMPEKFLNFYHFQQDYNVTTPDKTTLTYAAQNMDFADVSICQLPADDMLSHLSNHISYLSSPDNIRLVP